MYSYVFLSGSWHHTGTTPWAWCQAWTTRSLTWAHAWTRRALQLAWMVVRCRRLYEAMRSVEAVKGAWERETSCCWLHGVHGIAPPAQNISAACLAYRACSGGLGGGPLLVTLPHHSLCVLSPLTHHASMVTAAVLLHRLRLQTEKEYLSDPSRMQDAHSLQVKAVNIHRIIEPTYFLDMTNES